MLQAILDFAAIASGTPGRSNSIYIHFEHIRIFNLQASIQHTSCKIRKKWHIRLKLMHHRYLYPGYLTSSPIITYHLQSNRLQVMCLQVGPNSPRCPRKKHVPRSRHGHLPKARQMHTWWTGFLWHASVELGRCCSHHHTLACPNKQLSHRFGPQQMLVL